jgi:hypothetical protein
MTRWSPHGRELTGQKQIAQANQRYTDEIEPLYSQIGVPTLIVWERQTTGYPSI